MAFHPQAHNGKGGAPNPWVMPQQQFAQSTLKTPPQWNPSWEEVLPFAIWVQDVLLWAASTDVDPDRQAPLVVQALSGTARELCREIDIAVLQQGQVGDWGDGLGMVHHEGLAILLRGLSRKFAPLGIEQIIKDISQFMNLRRLSNEPVDTFLARFDLLKVRAERQGFLMNPVAQSWYLLTTLGLPHHQWPTILAPGQGNLPDTEAGLTLLQAYLRRQGHLLESGHNNLHQSGRVQGGTGNFFTSADDSELPSQFGFSAWQEGESWASETWEPPAAYWSVPSDGLDGEQCDQCGHYHVDSETDEDDGAIPNSAMFAEYWKSGYTEEQAGEEIFLEYLAAKQKWRRFSSRPVRSTRFANNAVRRRPFSSSAPSKGGKYSSPNFRSGKGHFQSDATSFLPGNSLAGGKSNFKAGKGGNSGKGAFSGKGSRNPIGSDGKVLQCSVCLSETHLWRNCTDPRASAMGKGKGKSTSSSFPVSAFSSSAPANSVPAVSAAAQGNQWSWAGNSSASSSVPGTFWHTSQSANVQHSSQSPESSVHNPGKLPSWLLVSSAAGPLTTPQEQAALHDADHYQIHTPREDEVLQVGGFQQVNPKQQDRMDRRAQHLQSTILSLRDLSPADPSVSLNSQEPSFGIGASLFYPWWPVPQDTAAGELVTAFHTKTRLVGGNREGLLVDPGAWNNLMGESWYHRQCRLAALHGRAIPPLVPLVPPLEVGGVGKSTQTCREVGLVPLGITELVDDGEYAAPIIPNSEVPALLGLCTLKRKHAILNTSSNQLIIPGPGGVQIKLSPGSLVLQLESSPSGHLLLPVSNFRKQASGNRVSFTVEESVAVRSGQSASSSSANHQ